MQTSYMSYEHVCQFFTLLSDIKYCNMGHSSMLCVTFGKKNKIYLLIISFKNTFYEYVL